MKAICILEHQIGNTSLSTVKDMINVIFIKHFLANAKSHIQHGYCHLPQANFVWVIFITGHDEDHGTHQCATKLFLIWKPIEWSENEIVIKISVAIMDGMLLIQWHSHYTAKLHTPHMN